MLKEYMCTNKKGSSLNIVIKMGSDAREDQVESERQNSTLVAKVYSNTYVTKTHSMIICLYPVCKRWSSWFFLKKWKIKFFVIRMRSYGRVYGLFVLYPWNIACCCDFWLQKLMPVYCMCSAVVYSHTTVTKTNIHLAKSFCETWCFRILWGESQLHFLKKRWRFMIPASLWRTLYGRSQHLYRRNVIWYDCCWAYGFILLPHRQHAGVQYV